MQSKVSILPRQYLLTADAIIDYEDYSKKGEFIGEVVLAEEGSITTLVGGKISMTKINRANGVVSTE
jgi:hypothetical protein